MRKYQRRFLEATGLVPVVFTKAFAERNVGNLTPAQQFQFYGVIRNQTDLALIEAQRLCGLFNHAWCYHLDQDDVNALWAEGRLYDFNPNWSQNHNEGVPPPTAAEINQWSIRGFGHDAVNNWICVKAKCQRLGYPVTCEHCQGDGNIWSSPEAKALYDNWVEVEPPLGEGYQVWETVTEGSPISPIFATTEDLERWLIGEGYSEGATEEFAKQGFAFSMMMVNGMVYKDIESLNAAQDGD